MKRVQVKVTYECGRCGNIVVKEYVSDGKTLEIPNVYCGKCIKTNGPVTMSASYTGAKVEETDETAEVQRPGGHDKVPAAGNEASAFGAEAQGRKPADTPGNPDSKPVTGEPGSQGQPGVPPKKGLAGGSAK